MRQKAAWKMLMTYNSRLLFDTFCLLLLFFFITMITPALAAEGCAAAQCHSNIKMHPSDKSCNLCHTSSPSHPVDGKVETSEKACVECHKEILDYDYLHSPVAAADCKACHTPHSDKSYFLITDNESSLCYTCHNQVVSKDDPFLHGGISQGKCLICHSHHGSFFSSQLRAEYSKEFFNDYSDNQYGLCFNCHKIDLLLHPKTSYNTNFRDGKINLHYLHVNRKIKGRACKTCHGIHSSPKEKLMADNIYFGNWQMPIGFEITENGGSCTPGCHKPEAYSRTSPSNP